MGQIIIALIVIISLIGYLNNLFWIFTNLEFTAQFLIAVIGLFAFPLGAIHGIYVMF